MFKDNRYDVLKEYISEGLAELKRYTNKRFDIVNEYLDHSRKETNKYVDDMFRVQRISIDHLNERITLLEKEIDELKKQIKEQG